MELKLIIKLIETCRNVKFKHIDRFKQIETVL